MMNKKIEFSRSDIKNNLYDLYSVYRSYLSLYAFYQENKKIKTPDEIRKRVDYILKHQINQKNELETLMWVLGETNETT